jgi:hypothetical protein
MEAVSVEFVHDHEREKALRKLRRPDLLVEPPEKRWRTTQWFGVAKKSLQTLTLQGELEHRVASSNGMDLWRKRH